MLLGVFAHIVKGFVKSMKDANSLTEALDKKDTTPRISRCVSVYSMLML